MNAEQAKRLTEIYLTGCGNTLHFDGKPNDPAWACPECTDDFFRNRLLPALGIPLPVGIDPPRGKDPLQSTDTPPQPHRPQP